MIDMTEPEWVEKVVIPWLKENNIPFKHEGKYKLLVDGRMDLIVGEKGKITVEAKRGLGAPETEAQQKNLPLLRQSTPASPITTQSMPEISLRKGEKFSPKGHFDLHPENFGEFKSYVKEILPHHFPEVKSTFRPAMLRRAGEIIDFLKGKGSVAALLVAVISFVSKAEILSSQSDSGDDLQPDKEPYDKLHNVQDVNKAIMSTTDQLDTVGAPGIAGELLGYAMTATKGVVIANQKAREYAVGNLSGNGSLVFIENRDFMLDISNGDVFEINTGVLSQNKMGSLTKIGTLNSFRDAGGQFFYDNKNTVHKAEDGKYYWSVYK
jgi:hypothetical protein